MQFESEKLLVEALAAGPCSGRGWLLGIDGDQRAGKSALSLRLAEELDAEVVSCDAFMQNGKMAYPEALDLRSLADRISLSVEKGASLVVESVMLQLILDALGVKPAAIVYVRHNWPAGTYTRPELFDPEATKAAYEYELDLSRCFHKSEVGLDGEILRYHLHQRPHVRSTYLLENAFELVS